VTFEEAARKSSAQPPPRNLVAQTMRIEKASSTVFTSLEDGRGVLLNLDSLLYYSLNQTGSMIWRQIEQGKSVTLDDLLSQVCQRYEVTENEARPFLKAFVERLDQLKLVRIDWLK
jgi:hypothetical protein